MTTWTAPEDGALADALSEVVARLERQRAKGACEAAREMRSAVTPGNRFRTASVPHAVRPAVAAQLRAVAATGHPLAERLEGIAAGFDQEAAARAANGI
jgi:hypothetical protein